MSTNTEHYALQIDQGSDIFNPLTSIFPNFQKIDTAMWANKLGGVVTGTHLLSGSIHAITVSDAEGFAVFRFVATANYSEGQTFTVNGTPVTAATTAGTSLGSGCFVVNQNVLCCLVGTQLTLYVSDTGGTAADSEKLGGELPSYYATATQLTGVQAIANNALQTANSANTTASGASATASAAQQAANAAKPVLLWTNPSPTTEFQAQTVDLDLSDYGAVMVVFKQSTVTSAYIAGIGIKDVLNQTIFRIGTSSIADRRFTPSDTGIQFTACYDDAHRARADLMLPYKIYGVALS